MTQAWKRDRLDLADHFHSVWNDTAAASRTPSLISAADLYYEIGSHAFNAQRPDIAMVWLRRVLSALKDMGDDASLGDDTELHLNAPHTLGTTQGF